MTKLYSYVVKRDYGFAPNPFFGTCTLATCKPRIRKTAEIGAWVIGTGSKTRKRHGQLVFVMRVSEKLSFNEYWEDQRFQRKRPNLQRSKKQAFGDNIYHKDENGEWHQADSHHSYEDGSCNPHNVVNDTSADSVLIGVDFAFWGDSGPQLPETFRDYNGKDIYAGRGHKSRFPETMVTDFVIWFRSLDAEGYLAEPGDWRKSL